MPAIAWSVALLWMGAAAAAPTEGLPPFNAVVLEIVASYPDGGPGGYAWPAVPGTHGTSRDLRLGDERIARAGTGTHCVGITLEVLWTALERASGGRPGRWLTAADARRLRRLWFVPEDGGQGPAEALPAVGLGRRIVSLDDARPGDFVQVWLDEGWGHSMVFLDWLRDETGRITGLRYWSSQPWTGGIGTAVFAVGDGPGQVRPARIFIGRAAPPTSASPRRRAPGRGR